MFLLRRLFDGKYISRPWLLLLACLCLITGLFMGFLGAGKLNGSELAGLDSTLKGYMQYLGGDGSGHVFWQSLTKQGTLVLQLLLFGTSIIGLPLIMATLFVRGFGLGYTCSVILQTSLGGGWPMLFLGVLPHTLLAIPLCLMAAVWCGDWSLDLLMGTGEAFRQTEKYKGLSYRLPMILFFFIFALVTSLVEGYLSPFLLSLLA